jgi:hypothetical protein
MDFHATQTNSKVCCVDDNTCRPEWQTLEESAYIKMPAGTYYVGDMAYVLSPEMKCELKLQQFDETGPVDGKFNLSDGRVVTSFSQSGTQPDGYNDVIFQIETGTIGITLLDGLAEQWVPLNGVFVLNGFDTKKRTTISDTEKTMMDYINAVGTIVVYDEDFVCSKCTCRHSEFDQTESIYFGDNVDVFSINVIQNLGKRTR